MHARQAHRKWTGCVAVIKKTGTVIEKEMREVCFPGEVIADD